MEEKVNQIAIKPEYEYTEAEIIEVTIEERVKALAAAYEGKQRIKRIEDDNEPRLKCTKRDSRVPIQPSTITRVSEHTEAGI